MRRLGIALLATTVAAVGCNFNLPKRATQPTEAAPPTVDDRNTKYRPGQSVIRNTLRSGQRGAARHDFDQLKTLIVALELSDGRFPTADAIKADLKANPNARVILKKIEDGVIVLTGTTNRQGMWAYEIDADIGGGIVIVNDAVADASADDVKQYLGKK